MKINKLTILALLGVFILNSCSNDDDNLEPLPEGDYADGFFVLNEGGVGTVSYVSKDLNTVDKDVFATVNPDASDLGQFTQSMFFDDDRAYIISGRANIITVVDRYTFKLIDIIDEGLVNPRYGVVEGDKIYVTNNNTYTSGEDDDYIAVLDLETYELETKIRVGFSEEIIAEDGLIYVSGKSYEDPGNEIFIIDPRNNSILKTLTTSGKINSFKIEDGVIYSLTGNAYQKFDKITGEELAILNFETISGASRLDIEDDYAYFVVGSSVYKMGQNATEEPSEAIFTSTAVTSTYGFDVEDDRIYLAHSGDYVSDSFVEIYSLDGSLLKNITVGIAPNGFYFN
eukprot:TRINITY_DN58966_c0_g1_i1.p1 TRINITY_DN58966_c0_g1~~TRINITY_DN58966_c0_g1_i1.p1  ORF type:complete len:342 (-),score=12.23 TRINITY_DN58966_c0_g1_i1:23-1048(-)